MYKLWHKVIAFYALLSPVAVRGGKRLWGGQTRIVLSVSHVILVDLWLLAPYASVFSSLEWGQHNTERLQDFSGD